MAAQSAPTGWRRAVAIVNLETRLTYTDVPIRAQDTGGKDLTFLEEANLHRDAFSGVCPHPLILWLTEPAEAALGKYAPDLWHWRSARFDFEREGVYLNDSDVDPSQRLAWYTKITAASRRLGDKRGEFFDLLNLAEARRDLGQYTAARKDVERASKIAAIQDEPTLKGIALLELSQISEDQAQLRKAIQQAKDAAAVFEQLQDREGQANTAVQLSRLLMKTKKWREAIPVLEQALGWWRELHHRRGEGLALQLLAVAWASVGETLRAIDLQKVAIEIHQRWEFPEMEMAGLVRLSGWMASAGQRNEAAATLEEALRIAEKFQLPEATVLRRILKKLQTTGGT